MRSGRGRIRSAMAPAYGPSSSTGSDWSRMPKPIFAADPVDCSRYQLTPRTCIQVPVTEIRSAAAHNR
jgi:hypothetical protein